MAYTNIDDPSAYFQTKVYTGSNSNQSITNDGNSDLQPDLIFASYRTLPPYTNHKAIIDSSRGRAKILESDTAAAEATTTLPAYDLVSFDTDGFTVGAVNSTSGLNASGISHVAWQWKANGGTTSSNTDGDVTSTVQVNQDAGFSIITDGPHANTNARTIGHGLGKTPTFIIRRARNRVENWRVLFDGFGTTGGINLDDEGTYNSSTTLFTGVTSTTFGVGTDFSVNGGYDYITYCFTDVQ